MVVDTGIAIISGFVLNAAGAIVAVSYWGGRLSQKVEDLSGRISQLEKLWPLALRGGSNGEETP